jgi:hypothetical protein
VIFLPTNRPDVILPVVVAVARFAPVPCFTTNVLVTVEVLPLFQTILNVP